MDPVVSDPQSGAGFDRFAYVNNSPLSGVDPSGLYTCSGSAEECQRADDAVNKLREARDKTDRDSEDYKRLDSAIRALGRKGEDTGVEFFPLVRKKGTPAAATREGRLIVDFDQISHSARTNYRRLNGDEMASGKSDNQLVNEVAATIISHEVWHLIFYRSFGYPNSRPTEYSNELFGYRAQVATERALGLQGIWRLGMSADQINAAISKFSALSTGEWCRGNVGACP